MVWRHSEIRFMTMISLKKVPMRQPSSKPSGSPMNAVSKSLKYSHVLETNLRHFQTNSGLSVLENGDHLRQGLASGHQKYPRAKKCQANIEPKSRVFNIWQQSRICLRLCRHSISRIGCMILQPVLAKNDSIHLKLGGTLGQAYWSFLLTSCSPNWYS